MDRFEIWGALLIVAALVALFVQVRHWRRGTITTPQAIAGIIARAGFLLLGIVYATELIDRWRRGPFIGLAIVGTGIVLHLAVNIVRSVQRQRNAE